MPQYNILLTSKAQKQFDKLPDNIAEPILNAFLVWKKILDQ
jgi:mRNA-degrading endonuclease RelE of RelBE toxin-antitoxin system